MVVDGVGTLHTDSCPQIPAEQCSGSGAPAAAIRLLVPQCQWRTGLSRRSSSALTWSYDYNKRLAVLAGRTTASTTPSPRSGTFLLRRRLPAWSRPWLPRAAAGPERLKVIAAVHRACSGRVYWPNSSPPPTSCPGPRHRQRRQRLVQDNSPNSANVLAPNTTNGTAGPRIHHLPARSGPASAPGIRRRLPACTAS